MSLSYDDYVNAALARGFGVTSYLPPAIVPYGAAGSQFAVVRWSRSKRGVMVRKWRPASASWSKWGPYRGPFLRLAESTDYSKFSPDFEAAWRD